MKIETVREKMLEYLHEHGPTNTFRLSRDLKIDRHELTNIIKELTKKGLIKFRSGMVIKKEPQEEKIKSKDVISSVPESSKSKIPEEKYSKSEKIKRKIQKERKKAEKDLAEREISLRQREESVKKREESVSAALKKLKKDKALLDKEQKEIIKKIAEITELGKEKEKIIKARKNLRKEKKQISKAKVLKEDINKLEAILEDLKKKISIEKRKLKKLKEKETKPKVKSTLKSKMKKSIKISKIGKIPEHAQEPKILDKIRVSNIETEQPGIMPEDRLYGIEENVYDKFHDLIEQEINLLKQKRIHEARAIHLKLKDMISEVTDPDQRRIIITDWKRIKEFCQ